MNKTYILFLIFCLWSLEVVSQKSKDGAGSVTAAGTVINLYTPLAADATAGSKSLSLSNPAGFSSGDLVMVIQMQGATILSANDTTWGRVSSYNSAGLLELGEIVSVAGNTITLSCPLVNAYSVAGKTQVVRVPRYSSLNISAGASVVATPWNGTSGGVVVAEVAGDITLNGSINVNGLGFRGGQLDDVTGDGCVNFSSSSPYDGAEKGEGIAGYQADYDIYGGRYGKGAPANGGGGGNCHNGAGGGGANAGTGKYTGNGNPDISVAGWITAWNLESPGFANSTSSGGGRGGYTYGDNNMNALTVPLGDPSWGGDTRRNQGGKGGRPLNASSTRLFLGGGGGAGDANNQSGGAGGNGGGMVYLIACGKITGTGSIIANGQDGFNTTGGHNDAVGGGGGGGTIFLSADGGVTGVSLTANGGKGGNQLITSSESEGAGGGGGGGYIAITSGTPARTAAGGANGTTTSGGVTEFKPNGATKGGAGIANETVPVYNPVLTVKNDTICSGSSVTLTATLTGFYPANTTICWYTTTDKTTQLGTGASLSVGPLTVKPGVLFSDTTFYVTTCPYNCAGAVIYPVKVTIAKVPLSDAGADKSVCPGETTQIGAISTAGYKYKWSPSSYLSKDDISNPVFQGFTNAVVLKYTLRTSNWNCFADDDVNITINPKPDADAGPDQSVCTGTTVQIGANKTGNTYSWTPVTDLDNPNISNPKFLAINPGNTPITRTFLLTETSLTCSDTESVVITINPYPVPDAGRDTTVCSGPTLKLGSSSIAGHTYSWSPAAGLDNPNSATPSFLAINGGNAPVATTFTLTETAYTCQKTDQVTITVNPGPVPDAGADRPVCSGATVQLGAASQAGYTYSWSPATGLDDPTIANPSFQTSNTGNVPLSQTYILTTTRFGCTATDDVTITVNPYPKPDAGPDQALCSGPSIKLGTSAVADHTYSWSPATGLDDPASATPNFLAINNGSTPVQKLFRLTETSYGCSDTNEVRITINPVPVPNAGSDQPVCSGGTVQMGGPSQANYTYSWSPVTGLDNPSISNPVYLSSNTGVLPVDNTFTLTTTLFGCTATDDVTITVNPIPIPEAGQDQSVCAGLPVQIGAPPKANYTYKWVGDVAVTPDNTANPTLSLANTGNSPQIFNFYLVADLFTCQRKDTVTITVNPTPIADAGQDHNVCSGTPVQIGTTAASPNYQYQWSPAIPAGNAPGDILNLTNTSSAAYTNEYLLTTTLFGCTDTDNVKVTVKPYPVIDAGNYREECSGTSIQLGTDSVPGYIYKWTPADSLSDAGAAKPTFKALNGGTTAKKYPYKLTVDFNGCDKEDTVSVSIKPYPNAYAGKDTTFCKEVKMQLGQGNNPLYTYDWSPKMYLNAYNISNPVINIVNTGTSLLTVKYNLIVNSNGCTDTANVTFTAYPEVHAEAGASIAACKNQDVKLTATGGGLYKWSTGATSPEIKVQPLYTTTYYVTVENVCKDVDSVVVTIKNDEFNSGVYIPNAFSPNEDSLNEVFKVEGTFVSDLKVFVFNRWGELIYDWEGITNHWDGKLNGTVVQEGVYVYLVRAKNECGELKTYNGIVTVVK